MKNTNLLLTVILFSMIAIILVAGIALIVVLGNGSDGAATEQTTPNAVIVNTTPTSTTPWVPPFVTPAPSTTTVPSTTPPTPVTTTQPTPSVTTTVPPVTTTQKVPEVSTPATAPETDPGVTTPPTTVTPPTTTKPDTPPPAPETISGIIEGEKVGSLGLYASYTAVTNPADETVTLKVTFYVESYALRIGARNDNYLLINGEKLGRLSNEAISLPDKSPLTRTVLYEYETVLQTDSSETTSLELEFFWHFQATYSGIHKEWLTVKVELAF